jgi:hypothetical protein
MPGALLWGRTYRGVLAAYAAVRRWLCGPTVSELCARVLAFLTVLFGDGDGLRQRGWRRKLHLESLPSYRSVIFASSLLLHAPPVSLL